MDEEEKNILIAYLPSRKDLAIAVNEKWYRIPVSTKKVPKIVQNASVELIAFYQPKAFGDDAHLVRYYGVVKTIAIEKRKRLLKDEPLNPKSDDLYYKIEFDKLLRLPQSIISLRRRRILFIVTSLARFQNAKEINDLFLESPLEEKFWAGFKNIGLYAERQYFEQVGNHKFILDFALFCKNRKLAVECDGDKYHTNKKLVQKDKRRDNLLESRGWNVLRYTTDDIANDFDKSINQVRETVNRYGGLENPFEPGKSLYFPDKEDGKTLFG